MTKGRHVTIPNQHSALLNVQDGTCVLAPEIKHSDELLQKLKNRATHYLVEGGMAASFEIGVQFEGNDGAVNEHKMLIYYVADPKYSFKTIVVASPGYRGEIEALARHSNTTP